MGLDDFGAIVNMLYVAKEVYDLGRFDLIQNNYSGCLDYDFYYENMQCLISEIFSDYRDYYNDEDEVGTMVFFDPVITEFYKLASDYGIQREIAESNNIYLKSAKNEAERYLNFNYSMGWILYDNIDPKKVDKSRLVILTDNEFCDFDSLAHGLIKLYEWFTDKCEELKKKLAEEVIAA